MPAVRRGGTLVILFAAKTSEIPRMVHRYGKQLAYLAAVLVVTLLLGACGSGTSKSDVVQSANIPKAFDVTVLAEKDTTFDYEGAPLTAEDLRSALRYRKEEKLPVATILMKRGEKQKIKYDHIIALARIAYQMNIKAYIQEKNGEISEIRAQVKDDEAQKPEPKPEAGK
jgi:hypothetical protein